MSLPRPDRQSAVGNLLAMVLGVIKRDILVQFAVPDINANRDAFQTDRPRRVDDDAVTGQAGPTLLVALLCFNWSSFSPTCPLS